MTTATPVPVAIRPRPATAATPAIEAMPLEGPLIDRFGRVHRDMRLSVTDRCNFRCVHCLPEDGVTFLPRSAVLGFDEIVRTAAIAHRLGITSVRITGGNRSSVMAFPPWSPGWPLWGSTTCPSPPTGRSWPAWHRHWPRPGYIGST